MGMCKHLCVPVWHDTTNSLAHKQCDTADADGGEGCTAIDAIESASPLGRSLCVRGRKTGKTLVHVAMQQLGINPMRTW